MKITYMWVQVMAYGVTGLLKVKDPADVSTK
jgi:hypothetical protein